MHRTDQAERLSSLLAGAVASGVGRGLVVDQPLASCRDSFEERQPSSVAFVVAVEFLAVTRMSHEKFLLCILKFPLDVILFTNRVQSSPDAQIHYKCAKTLVKRPAQTDKKTIKS